MQEPLVASLLLLEISCIILYGRDKAHSYHLPTKGRKLLCIDPCPGSIHRCSWRIHLLSERSGAPGTHSVGSFCANPDEPIDAEWKIDAD